MNSTDTVTISTSLPVTVNPSSAEIVFNPITNSYALSVGVKVQLPINELVEVLLRFNQEQMLVPSHVEDHSSVSHSVLAFLPEPTAIESVPQDSSVYTPKASIAHASTFKRRSKINSFPDDEFARISISVIRQEPALFEYRERAKWHKSSGRFFVDNSEARAESHTAELNSGFALFAELPVNEQFAYHPRSASMESTKGLSANAPVFTPGSAFASTYTDSLRSRSMSESYADVAGSRRSERAMSMAYLPPSVMEEESDVNAFWSKITAIDSEAPVEAPAFTREESRPAECKQM